ncbi:MAG: DUF502 domain-containing protein [Pirellulaceae bacterium]|nr:DUF502 domain-containing protein [Pirellulaceae bacterium]
MNSDSTQRISDASKPGGFRRAILRGLGVVMPPLLTIVVLLWAWNTIESYLLKPIESRVRHAIVWTVEESYSSRPEGATKYDGQRWLDGFVVEGRRFIPDPTGRRFFPEDVKRLVDEKSDYWGPDATSPATANAYWHRYVEYRFMPRWIVVPVFLILFTTMLYFLGRMFTFGLGRWFVHAFDRGVLRIPVVNKVYGSVKQVTDFAFSEREIEFNRVVAIQYPSQGIWSLGFVTGSSMREIAEATGEEMLSVLMPTSPMPMTGFTVTVKRSDAIDLNLTVDEAIQFVVSCGVVVPPQQRNDKVIEASAESTAVPPNLTGGSPSGQAQQTQP